MTRVLALLVAAVLTVGSTCSREAEPPPAADDGQAAVLASREALAQPMTALADAVLALSSGVAEARYKVARGEEMADALKEVENRRRAVLDAADSLAAAAEVPVAEAGEIAERAAQSATSSAKAARAELGFLRRVAAIDTALLAAAETWDEPGSQSEIRARLDALAGKVKALAPKVRRLKPKPAGCDVLRSNRAAWVRTVVERTKRLQSQANSAGGSTFDELRTSYRALPFAEEPRTADRADRDCWLQRSRVARGEQQIRAAIDELRAALSG